CRFGNYSIDQRYPSCLSTVFLPPSPQAALERFALPIPHPTVFTHHHHYHHHEMTGTFMLVGGTDKKLPLEKQMHRCPKCKDPYAVQLTRRETQIYLFNKPVGDPKNERVQYECNKCSWRNETYPEQDSQ
ncbi:hypothetical protein BC936DRAFT_144176, partial [Jimgerdemannia flammicorona]